MAGDVKVNGAALENFLRNLLVDSEAGGRLDNDKAPPGFVTWLRMRTQPEDFYICEWDGRAETAPPTVLEADFHGAAYAIAMEALILLRRWWRESDYLEDEPAYAVAAIMRGDISAVIEYLDVIRGVLPGIEAGSWEGQLEKTKEEMARAVQNLGDAERTVASRREEMAKAESCMALQNLLTEGPLEQLSRAADEITQDHEE